MSKWLVREIQEDILGNKSLTNILRKALILYKKLKLDGIDFIEKELNWYNENDEIPNYRIIKWYRILWWNPYQWRLLANINDDKLFDKLVTRKIFDWISEVEKFTKWADIVLPNQFMSSFMNVSTEYKVSVSWWEFTKIIESIKNILLNRCIELENSWILWEWISFSKEEIKKASEINQTINNFHWIINDSNLQISSPNSNQKYKKDNFDIDKLYNLFKEVEKVEKEIEKMPKWENIINSFKEIKTDIENKKIDNKSTIKKIISVRDTLSWMNWNLIANWIIKLISEIFN